MTGDTTDSDWSGFDLSEFTDHNLITDISERLRCMSGENRARRRRQKLRQDLVRAHIEKKQQSATFLKSIFDKLFKSK